MTHILGDKPLPKKRSSPCSKCARGRSRLSKLLRPKKRHRINLVMRGENGCGGFETRANARAEDATRIKRIGKSRGLKSALIGTAAAKDLAKRLKAGVGSSKTPKTLASSRYIRDQRIRFTGALLKLAEPWKSKHLRTFTLLPKAWEIRTADLNQADPKKLLQQLRSTLNRRGAAAANGFLVAVLHGEFEPEAGIYRLHVHGVAGGGMVKIIDGLRGLESYGPRPDVARPVRLSKLKDRPRQLSYLLKAYWPCRRIGPVGPEGKIKRNRAPQRLPEPYHTQNLLWLDKRDLSDVILLMGCKATKDGIAQTNKIVDRPYMKI